MARIATREMGISRAELLRLVGGAIGAAGFTAHGDRLTVMDGDRRVEIRIEAETVRKLGTLQLPVTHLTLRFDGFSASDMAAWLRGFDRAFQRGGG